MEEHILDQNYQVDEKFRNTNSKVKANEINIQTNKSTTYNLDL